MTLARPWLRIALYTLLAMTTAAAMMFIGLRNDRVCGDEAVYASCVDTIVETGQWLSPAPYPGAVYFQKPPLQMWLSAATYNVFPDIVRYRVWSAAFGVLAVGLTCLLAGVMFAPEVGLIAALLLATNQRFVYDHGARSGTFDSALTFFILLGTAIYWRFIRTATPPSSRIQRAARVAGWVSLGVVVGLAGMLKTVAGLPLMLLLFVHVFMLPRPQWQRQFAALFGALAVSLIMLLPWYVAQGVRFGTPFWHDMFAQNIVQRATVGVDPRQIKPITYFPMAIAGSAAAFALVLPAIVFAVIAGFVSSRRAEWRLAVIAGVGWVAIFSVSHSKFTHYIYPAMPALCICIAGLIAWMIGRAAGLWRIAEFRERTFVAGYGGVILALLFNATYLAARHVDRPGKKYQPYEIYQALAPAIEGKTVRFIVAGFDKDRPVWLGQPGVDSIDSFYLRRMPGAQRVPTGTPLAALLDQHLPTLLVAPPNQFTADSPVPDARIDPRFSAETGGYQMVGIDMAAFRSNRSGAAIETGGRR